MINIVSYLVIAEAKIGLKINVDGKINNFEKNDIKINYSLNILFDLVYYLKQKM